MKEEGKMEGNLQGHLPGDWRVVRGWCKPGWLNLKAPPQPWHPFFVLSESDEVDGLQDEMNPLLITFFFLSFFDSFFLKEQNGIPERREIVRVK